MPNSFEIARGLKLKRGSLSGRRSSLPDIPSRRGSQSNSVASGSSNVEGNGSAGVETPASLPELTIQSGLEEEKSLVSESDSSRPSSTDDRVLEASKTVEDDGDEHFQTEEEIRALFSGQTLPPLELGSPSKRSGNIVTLSPDDALNLSILLGNLDDDGIVTPVAPPNTATAANTSTPDIVSEAAEAKPDEAIDPAKALQHKIYNAFLTFANITALELIEQGTSQFTAQQLHEGKSKMDELVKQVSALSTVFNSDSGDINKEEEIGRLLASFNKEVEGIFKTNNKAMYTLLAAVTSAVLTFVACVVAGFNPAVAAAMHQAAVTIPTAIIAGVGLFFGRQADAPNEAAIKDFNEEIKTAITSV